MILGAGFSATLLSSLGAQAAIVPYTSAATFDAATMNDTTYDFAGLTQDTNYKYYPTGVKVGPTTFTSGGNLFVVGANAGGGAYGVPFLSGQDGTPNLLFTMSGESALGFDYGSYFKTSDPLDIIINGSDVFVVNLPATTSTLQFFGVTSSTPITSLTIRDVATTSTYSGVDLTDFTVGSIAGGVPEPSTWVMMLLGFGGLGFLAFGKIRESTATPMMAA